MTLLRRTDFVVFQDLGDDADEPIQLRPLRRLAAAIAGRNREPHHLGNRPGINAEAASRLPMAQTFPLNGKANASIQIHVLHPQPSAQKAKSYLPPDYCSGATEQTGRFSEGFLLRRLQNNLITAAGAQQPALQLGKQHKSRWRWPGCA